MTVQELTQNQKLNYWYNHILAQRNSGVSIKKHCVANGLTQSTFYEYLKKIKQLLCDEINTQSSSNAVVPFVAVPKPVAGNEDKIIITKGSIKIEFDSSISYQSIEPILRSLLC